MSDAPLLECSRLAKAFGAGPVLRGVSLAVYRGQVTAVVGENGAGKSTLMNIIAGVLPADSGEMRLAGSPYAPRTPADSARAGIAFVHQELNLFPNLPIADNLFLGGYPTGAGLVRRREVRERTRSLLRGVNLDLDPELPVERLSQAERQLIEIARALGAKSQLILLDEPTSSLGVRDAERLFDIIGTLTARGLAVVFVSHALDDVLRVSDCITVLRDGAVVAEGITEDFSKERLITTMIGRSLQQLSHDRVLAVRCNKIALQAEHLSQPGILHDICLRLYSGEILGISGLMGSGRSELARVLFGLDPCREGDIVLNGESIRDLSPRGRISKGMAFVTESRREDGLFPQLPIASNLRIVYPRAGPVDDLAASLQIRCADLIRQPVAQLSGGNQQKVALGKWLVRTPKVMIIDEPTRGIDVGARFEIYSLLCDLAARGIGLLVISSDIEELTGLCDRILVMRKGEIAGEFPCAAFDREALMRAAV